MEWLYTVLPYITLIFLGTAAIISAALVFWSVIAVSTDVTAGAMLVGGAFLIQAFFVSAPSIAIGMNISSDDAVFSLLGAGLFVKLFSSKNVRADPDQLRWLGLGVVMFVSMSLGLLEYGSKAGVEVRGNFYFWTAGLYFSAFAYTPALTKKLWKILASCALLTAVIAVYRWVGLKFGFVSADLIELAGAGSEFRSIGSSQTFLIGIVGVVYFSHWLRHPVQRFLFLSLLMFALVLVLQHRSVWIATLGALAVVFWCERRVLEKRALIFAVITFILMSLVVTSAMLGLGERLFYTVSRSVGLLADSKGTHMDRLLGWKVLLTDFVKAPAKDWFLGTPYGAGFARWINGRLAEYSPHNFFVEILLRLGLLGLTAFLWVNLSLSRRISASINVTNLSPTVRVAFLATFAANLLYFIPYQGFYLQGAFYGFVIGYLKSRNLNFGTNKFFSRSAGL